MCPCDILFWGNKVFFKDYISGYTTTVKIGIVIYPLVQFWFSITIKV